MCLRTGATAEAVILNLVECKNWSGPAGCPELAVLYDELQSRGRPLRILVAAAGITGDPEPSLPPTACWLVRLAEVRILVITRSEIDQLADTDELLRLPTRKQA